MISGSGPARGSSIFSNYSWSILNLALSKGLRFAGIVLCIRQIGIESWGQIAAALVTVTFLGFLVDQGLSGTPQVYRVEDRSLDWPLVKTITRYRFLVALALVTCLHAGSLLLDLPSLLVLAYAHVLLVRSLSIEWLYHRRERFHLTLAINMIRMVAFFALIFLFVEPGNSPLRIIAIEMIAEVAGIVYSYAMLSRLGTGRDGGSGTAALKPLLIFAFPVLVTGIMDTALGSADVLVLKYLRGYEETGQYDIGAKVGMTYFFLGATLVQIILPKLARLHAAGDTAKMREILGSAGKLLLLVVTAFLIPSFYFSRELVEIIFRHDYPLTVFVFQWIPIWVYLTPLTMLNIILLLAMGRRIPYMLGTMVAAAVNLGSNFVLITALGGRGAVFSRFLAEGFLLIYSLSCLPAEIRAGRLRDLGIYAANLALQVALFQLHAAFGHRALFLGASLAGFLALVLWQGTLTRKTFSVMLSN